MSEHPRDDDPGVRAAPAEAGEAADGQGGQGFHAPLHGLRGLAVLYVVASHLANAGYLLLPIPLDAIGKVGVWIFFGLSAWLLTTRLADRLRKGAVRAELASYAIHRIFRIYPLYLAVLLVHVWLGEMSWATMGRHALLVAGQGELWAIPTEFRYYMVIPLLVLVPRRIGLAMAMLLAVFSMAWTLRYPETVTRSGIPLLPKAVPFLVASIVAIVAVARERSHVLAPAALTGLLVSTALFRFVAHDAALTGWMPWVSLGISLSVAGLIVALQAPGGWLKRIFASRPMVWIGEISFGVYLLHLFVLHALGHLELAPFAKAWLILAVSIALASLTYVTIERPGMRLGKVIGIRVVRKNMPERVAGVR